MSEWDFKYCKLIKCTLRARYTQRNSEKYRIIQYSQNIFKCNMVKKIGIYKTITFLFKNNNLCIMNKIKPTWFYSLYRNYFCEQNTMKPHLCRICSFVFWIPWLKNKSKHEFLIDIAYLYSIEKMTAHNLIFI